MPIIYNLTRDTNHATHCKAALLPLTDMQLTIAVALRAQAISSAQSILDAFLTSNENVYDELELWRRIHFRLSPGDHWERNGILKQLSRWGESGDPVFFCVGPFGSKHSWV